ncbi:MAG: hypothetical protein ABIZ36_10615 [Gemmatimonadaceae bacterium]
MKATVDYAGAALITLGWVRWSRRSFSDQIEDSAVSIAVAASAEVRS